MKRAERPDAISRANLDAFALETEASEEGGQDA
jgi:hypothetical protein